MSKATLAIKSIINRISKTLDDIIAPPEMKDLGDYALTLIVKRTLLGYGVDENYGTKQKLKPLTPGYVKSRLKFQKLSSKTTAKKSNLTRTGQLLDSMDVKVNKRGQLFIQPTGRRFDSTESNVKIAEYQSIQGRTFNKVSELEFKQLLRYYRKTFGDLLNRKRLLR